MNKHGVYPTQEVLALPSLRKGRGAMPLAEIGLALCSDGWRSSYGFGFSSGDLWGSWSPIFGSSPAFATRAQAVDHAGAHIRHEIAARTGAEADAIRGWLDDLHPAQTSLFET